jgi:hypothetical protein
MRRSSVSLGDLKLKLSTKHGDDRSRPVRAGAAWTSEELCDLSNLAIGAGLFLSPWILGFGAHSPNVPTQSAGVTGTAIAVLAIAALSAFEVWEEWLILVFAAWALAAPWVLGFEGTSAMFVHLASGAISLVVAATRLMLMRRSVQNER